MWPEYVQENIQRANVVLHSVWGFLQGEKSVELVPWVTNPKSPSYDALKEARWEGRKQALKEIEDLIVEESNRLKKEERCNQD